ncbi:MAG: hypothetical protein PHY47_00740 [Lachnospiraceae bacterium]|nr:hypothetical protein [Lachnospiraceae bacterium]
MALQAELTTEHEMTKEKLLEMVRIIENAEKHAMRGQTLHIKLNHTTTFVVRNVFKEHVFKGITKETEQIFEVSNAR